MQAHRPGCEEGCAAWGSCWGVQAATTSSTLPLYLFICCALGDDMGITALWVETEPFRTILEPGGGGGGLEIAGGRGSGGQEGHVTGRFLQRLQAVA